MSEQELFSRITIDPQICHGKPCIRGLRYPVEFILEMLSGPTSVEEFLKEALEKGDLYGVLGLEKLTYEAGDSDIRRAYQKNALKYHPDKLGDKVTAKDKEMWLKI